MAYGSTSGGGTQSPGGLNRLPTKVEYVGLREYPTIQFVDNTPFSDEYFNIVNFPNKLTSGKNLFKIKASSKSLVKDAQIHIEVLDSNGDPIYYEILKYFETDGTRVIAIHVTDQTPPGVATVYIASRITRDPGTNARIPYSREFNSSDYFNYPNLLWQRTVTLGPSESNSSEIIFTKQPSVTVEETIQPYFAPVIKYDVLQRKLGAGRRLTPNITQSRGYQIRPKRITENINVETNENGNIIRSVQTTTVKSSNASMLRTNYKFFDQTMVGAKFTAVNPKIKIPYAEEPTTIKGTEVTPPVIIMTDTGRIAEIDNTETSDFDILTDSTYDIANRRLPGTKGVDIDAGFPNRTFALDNAPGEPNYKHIGSTPGWINELSGSYEFTITRVLSSNEAEIVYDQTNGRWSALLSYEDLENTKIIRQFVDQTIGIKQYYDDYTKSGTGDYLNGLYRELDDETFELFDTFRSESQWMMNYDFTASWVAPSVTTITEQTQSFAQITLSNIEPATGDVYKIRTSYKPGGMFGDYIDMGETIVERVEILHDTSSFETEGSRGTFYNRIGYFTNTEDFGKYWTGSHPAFDTTLSGTGTPEHANDLLRGRRGIGLSPTYAPSDLMGGIQLYPSGGFSMPALGGHLPFGFGGDFAFVCLKDKYLTNVTAGTSYVLTFKAISKDSKIATGSYFHYDTTYDNWPTASPERIAEYYPYNRLNIYMSASNGNVIVPTEVIERYKGPVSDNDRRNARFLNSNTWKGYFGDYISHGPTQASDTDWYSDQTEIGSVIADINTPLGYGQATDYSMEFTVTEDAALNMFIVPRRGIWVIADISIKTLAETGYTPNYAQVNLRIPTQYYNTPLTFKFEYLNYLGHRANLDTIVYPVLFSGDNTVINGNYNLLSGSLYVSNQIGTGLEIAGVRSGFIRSTGYQGFKSASHTDQPGGFLMYSGSVLPGAPDNYQGVGLELVRDSASFFRFKTDGDDAGLEVRTDKFFLGSDTSQFISGSGGLFEISSDNFVLSSAGNVTGSNMLLTGNAKADILEYKHLDITKTNSGSYLNTFIYGGKYYYELDLSTNAAMFIRFDFDAGDIKYPIARITPPSGDDQNRSQTVYLECADNPGGLPLSAPSLISGDVELKLDPGDLLEQSFVTTPWNGSSYDRTYIVPTGCRVMCIRSKFDWKIQSMNNFKTATASFGALHLGDNTIITTANPDVDGGSF